MGDGKRRQEAPRFDTEMPRVQVRQEGLAYHGVASLQHKVPLRVLQGPNREAVVAVRSFFLNFLNVERFLKFLILEQTLIFTNDHCIFPITTL